MLDSLSLINHLQASFYSLSPATLEVAKVFFVAFTWIGGLTMFMYLKERNRQKVATA